MNAQQRRSQSSKPRIPLTVFVNEISILCIRGQISELCHNFEVFHSCLWIMVLFRIVTRPYRSEFGEKLSINGRLIFRVWFSYAQSQERSRAQMAL